MTAVEPLPLSGLTTPDLLLAWDQRRPRSMQRELGMSELGGCRRRAGYRLAGTEPTDAGGSLQAVMGTAIHAAVEGVYREMQAAGLIPADDLVEHEVHFAGITGHLDRYEAATATLIDVKTTSSNWLEHVTLHGPSQSHLWQVNLYAAALAREGRPVRSLVIDYVARDTGDSYRWQGRFDPQAVRDALDWLKAVRWSELDMLGRDHKPSSTFCRNCPFRSVCWDGAVEGRDELSVLYREDPDAAKWAQKLAEARADERDAKARADEAKGALDALRPNDYGKSDPLDVGWDKNLVWSVTSREGIDLDAVRAEYAAAGSTPPTKVSQSTRLTFVKKPTT